MPIVGNLSEFPLPEVLLLIGARTGRLRLLDVPEFGIMDIDFSEGKIQAMHMADNTFTESEDMVAKLSAVVEMQAGMFEFRLQPVVSVSRAQPLMVNQLVMTLVCYVDEKLEQLRASSSVRHRFFLVESPPDIWIEPELNIFFIMARQFLTPPGIYLDDLAQQLGVDLAVVHQNLTNLKLLGFVMSIEEDKIDQPIEVNLDKTISQKAGEFLRASRAVGELRRVTGRLPKIARSRG